MSVDDQSTRGLTEVSQEAFFERVNAESAKNRDIHPTIVNSTYPYISEWRFHKEAGRPLFGKTFGAQTGGTKRYFLQGSRV